MLLNSYSFWKYKKRRFFARYTPLSFIDIVQDSPRTKLGIPVFAKKINSCSFYHANIKHPSTSLSMKLEVRIQKCALLFFKENKISIIQSMLLRHRYTSAISMVIHLCLLHKSLGSENQRKRGRHFWQPDKNWIFFLGRSYPNSKTNHNQLAKSPLNTEDDR